VVDGMRSALVAVVEEVQQVNRRTWRGVQFRKSVPVNKLAPLALRGWQALIRRSRREFWNVPRCHENPAGRVSAGWRFSACQHNGQVVYLSAGDLAEVSTPRAWCCGGATSLVAVAQVHVLGKSKEGLAAWRR